MDAPNPTCATLLQSHRNLESGIRRDVVLDMSAHLESLVGVTSATADGACEADALGEFFTPVDNLWRGRAKRLHVTVMGYRERKRLARGQIASGRMMVSWAMRVLLRVQCLCALEHHGSVPPLNPSYVA